MTPASAIPSASVNKQDANAAGELPSATSAVLDGALARVMVALDELRVVATSHTHEAPISSQHVQSLIGRIAQHTLMWIEEWPA